MLIILINALIITEFVWKRLDDLSHVERFNNTRFVLQRRKQNSHEFLKTKKDVVSIYNITDNVNDSLITFYFNKLRYR